MDFTSCITIPFVSVSPHIHILALKLPFTPKIQKNIPKPNQTNKKEESHCERCSVAHSLPFCPYIFNCKCSSPSTIILVQGLWLPVFTIDNEPPQGLLLDIPPLPCAMEILLVWICRFFPFTGSRSPQVVIGMDQFIALTLCLGYSQVGQPARLIFLVFNFCSTDILKS